MARWSRCLTTPCASVVACDCAHTQHTCHPESGECICPPHTRGAACDECEDGYWGHDLELGCQVRTATCIFLTGKPLAGASVTPSLSSVHLTLTC